jgi:hypothetical protein
MHSTTYVELKYLGEFESTLGTDFDHKSGGLVGSFGKTGPDEKFSSTCTFLRTVNQTLRYLSC